VGVQGHSRGWAPEVGAFALVGVFVVDGGRLIAVMGVQDDP